MKNKNLLYQKVWNFQYGYTSPFQLYEAAKGNKALVQKLKLQSKLPAHNGCVNTICWNESGDHILSGSDDKHLCITSGYNYSILNSIQTGHKTNIFSAKFLPGAGDKKIISCSGDGAIVYTDINSPESSLGNIFKCHFGTAYEVLSVPSDSHTFLSCGEDGTVRWFDLRIKNKCSVEDCKEDILVNCWCAATSLAISPFTPYYLGVGCADGTVRIFDRRLLGTKATGSYTGSGIQAMVSRFSVPELEGRSHRITSLSYSPDGEEMLVSYSSDYIYLYEVKDCGEKEVKVLPKIGSKSSSKKGGAKSSCPVIRRLRVRGDWSDTGPSARPERESRASGQQTSLHTSLMQRMSDVLTRIFTGSSQSRTNPTSSDPSSSSHNESVPVTSENANEEPDSSSLNSNIYSSNNEDKSVQSSTNLEKSSDSSQIPSSQELPQNENAEISECTLDRPSTSSCEPAQNSQGVKEKSDDDPGKVTMGQSLKNLQDELSYRRKDFLEKHNIEPVINLHYNGKGVNSGLITMDVTNTLEREQVDLPAEEEEEQSVAVPEEEEERGTSNSSLEPQVSSTKEEDSDVLMADVSKASLPTSEPGMSCISESDLEAEKSDNESKDECEEEEEEEEEEDDDVESAVMDVSEEEEEETVDIRPTAATSTSSKFSSSRSEENLDDLEQQKVQMSNVPHPRVKTKFIGHRNARTMIKEATFWGNDFVMSGSDCGHIFIWDRYTTELVMILEADRHVVNCLQPHPFDPILASSGIDYDIKIWAPLQEEPFFDSLKAQEIVQRNEIMLEETRDTITVPASFMIRMLASLNHLRSSGGISGWRRAAREARNENVDSSS